MSITNATTISFKRIAQQKAVGFTFRFWVAVLAKDGLPYEFGFGKTSAQATKNLVAKCRKDETIGGFEDSEAEFIQAVRETENYGFDTFSHEVGFNKICENSTLYVAAVAENGMPVYSAVGLTEDQAKSAMVAELADTGDFPEYPTDDPEAFLEMLGETEEYGFDIFEQELT